MKFLVPFHDDSTLMFASRMRSMLAGVGIEAILMLEPDRADLSERQLENLLPDGPDIIQGERIYSDPALASFDAVLTSLGSREIRLKLKDLHFRESKERPAFVSFYAGLEFSPQRGFHHRANYDVVFLNHRGHMNAFLEMTEPRDWQYVSYGHPYFTTPKRRGRETSPKRDIYFFTQSVSPVTLEGRRFIIDMLILLARRYSDRQVNLKLRHIPGENHGHLHREIFAYPWLIDRYYGSEVPENLKLTDCTMDEAMTRAGYCITCTSTAAMDCISAQLPTMIYTDFPENYLDPLCAPMREEFGESGLLASLPDIVDLETRMPDPEWVASRFRGTDLLLELKAAVTAFKRRDTVDCDVAVGKFNVPFKSEATANAA